MRFINLSFITLLTVLSVQSCSLDNFIEGDSFDDNKNSVMDKKNYSIEGGVIVFQDIEGFKQTLSFLNNSTPTAVSEWEKSLGFNSMFKYYELASSDFCCGKHENNLEGLKGEYEGKILFSENQISPLLDLGNIGRIVNIDGVFKVGQSLVKYTKKNVISVIDGDLAKLEIALKTLKSDIKNGVYVGELSKNLKTNCPWYQSDSDNKVINGDDYRLQSQLWLLNSSFYIYDANIGGPYYSIVYEVKTNIKHQRKRFGFWVCDRKSITWGHGYNILHDLGNFSPGSNNFSFYPNSPVAGGTGWTAPNVCDFTYTYTLIGGLYNGYPFAIGIDIDRFGLRD